MAVPDAQAAVALLAHVRAECGERVSAFEIVGRPALELVLRHIPGARDPLQDAPAWTVLVELSDPACDAPLVAQLEQAIVSACAAGLASDAAIAASLSQAQALWALRENLSEAQRLEGASIKHDVSVPVSRVPEFLECAGTILRQRWPDVRIVAFGHIGDGNLHYNLSRPIASDNARFLDEMAEANRIVHDLVHALGGSISAEHGIGQLKRAELMRYKSPLELELMERVKRALDPHGLMNPGKVLPQLRLS